MQDTFRELMQQAMARGGKTSALQPLLWLVGIVLTSIVGAAKVSAPYWVVGILAATLILIILVILGVYIYLLGKDPDSLRSEHFKMYKMAVEKSLVGDNLLGLRDSQQYQPKSDASKIQGETL